MNCRRCTYLGAYRFCHMEKKKKAEAGLDSLPPLGYVKGTLL